MFSDFLSLWNIKGTKEVNFHFCTGCPKKIVPLLCDHCQGTVGSIISIFTQLHRPGFSLELELLIYGREKAKLVVFCFKNSSIVLQQCQNKVSFQGKGSDIVLKFSLHLLKGRKCSPMNQKHC